MTVSIFVGDCRTVMRGMEAESVHTCPTSPPYWGVRDFKVPPSVWGGDPDCRHRFRENFCRCGAWRGAYGLEPSLDLYVQNTVEIFREVRRVLRNDGTVWLNLGDCYATRPCGWSAQKYWDEELDDRTFRDKPFSTAIGFKDKDKLLMPARVALALQADGWWVRQDIVWQKLNPMPESVYDRPITAHEYVFLLTKSGNTLLWRHRDGRWVEKRPEPDRVWRHRETRAESREDMTGKKGWFPVNLWRGFDYYYEAEAIKEPSSANSHPRRAKGNPAPAGWDDGEGHHGSIHRNGRRKLADYGTGRGTTPKANNSFDRAIGSGELVPMRMKRSVWPIAAAPFKEAHFATFPPKLIEPCILAGCPKGGTVLDPFGGAGTTGLVAEEHGRNAILIEINPEYARMAKARIKAARQPKVKKVKRTRRLAARSGKGTLHATPHSA